MTGKSCRGGGDFNAGIRIRFDHTYKDIISIENLLEAWKEFVVGKHARTDVQIFERNLMDNILTLHSDLATKTYRHSLYDAFKINDPKPRDIHKAGVRDRLLHHAIYRKLYSFFDRIFIADSYSCREGKGVHKALNRFRQFAFLVSKNHTRTVRVLKCDIRKFFASVDHPALERILQKYIPDRDIIWLLSGVMGSFSSTQSGVGLPLGNLTSQLLVNIYMNEFDQFVKHKLKAKYYIRYADDFVVLSHDRNQLLETLPHMVVFLRDKLKLEMHPDKVSISTFASGVDFLGWIHFPDHRVLRTATKRRMFRRITETNGNEQVVASYRGMLSHGNTQKLLMQIPKSGGK